MAPVRPASPLFLLSIVSISATPIPASRTRWNTTPGSMSPLRVPITRPPCGDIPIDVATLRPPSTAHALAPFPRCSVMTFAAEGAMPSSAAVRRAT